MLNLLPPQYKEELKKEINFKQILILGTISLIFLVSLILVLLSNNIYIKGEADSQKFSVGLGEQAVQVGEIREVRAKIVQAAQAISKLNSFYKNKRDSTEILENIFQTLPENTYLTSLSWQKDSGRVLLSGFSPGRDILLEFKNNLEAKDRFFEVDFPPQNWVKPTDIFFQVSFKVK